MKVLVVGAAGGIGHEVVTQALNSGHQVTAYLRTPSKLGLGHPCLSTIQGDVLDSASLALAIAGQDVVVSTIGINSLKPTTLYSEGASNIVRAMKAANCSRFLGIGASAMHIDANDSPLLRYVGKPIVARILREHYADLARMEAIVESSRLDWTIVVPPRLTDGPRTGKYRTALNENVRGGKPAISRADCADYIVRHFNGQNSVSGLVFIAH